MLEEFLVRLTENIAARAAWRVGLAIGGYAILPAVVDTAVQAAQIKAGDRHHWDGRSITAAGVSGVGSTGLGFLNGRAAAIWLPTGLATAAGGAAVILAESVGGVVGGVLGAAPITGLPTWQEFGQEFVSGAALDLAGARHGSHLYDPEHRLHPEPLGETMLRQLGPRITQETVVISSNAVDAAFGQKLPSSVKDPSSKIEISVPQELYDSLSRHSGWPKHPSPAGTPTRLERGEFLIGTGTDQGGGLSHTELADRARETPAGVRFTGLPDLEQHQRLHELGYPTKSIEPVAGEHAKHLMTASAASSTSMHTTGHQRPRPAAVAVGIASFPLLPAAVDSPAAMRPKARRHRRRETRGESGGQPATAVERIYATMELQRTDPSVPDAPAQREYQARYRLALTEAEPAELTAVEQTSAADQGGRSAVFRRNQFPESTRRSR